MILYHGSNVAVSAIQLSKCRPNKDFGRGFYTTTFYSQAVKMAGRVAIRFGGVPYVSSFFLEDDFQEKNDVVIRVFTEAKIDWAMFVMNNRNPQSAPVKGYEDNNLDCKYDIVIGPVANDDLSMIFRLFERGIMSLETLLHEMKYRELSNQYSFHTERAVTLLQYRGSENV